ncbi:hypothetical protein [Spongorhabdus nitratireducens]
MTETIIGILIPLAIIGLFMLAPVWVNFFTIAERDKKHWAYPMVDEVLKSPRDFTGRLLGQPLLFFTCTQILTDDSFTLDLSLPCLLGALIFTAGNGVVKAFLTRPKLRQNFLLTLAAQGTLITLYHQGFLSITLHYLMGLLISVYQAFVILFYSLQLQYQAACIDKNA